MSVLTRSEILKLLEEGALGIEPFDEIIVRENGIDLRIGNEYAIYNVENQVVDPCEMDKEEPRRLFNIIRIDDDGRIVIPPHSFVLLTTFEYVRLPPNIVGLCNLRSTLARYGLSVPPTVVDAGFEGQVTIEVVNNGPNYVVLRPRMRFLHLVLIKAEGEVKYQGFYRGQRGVKPPKGLKGECP